MSDIRKWFMKAHDKNAAAGNSASVASEKPKQEKPKQLPSTDVEAHDTSSRRKTSKYFAASTAAKADTSGDRNGGSKVATKRKVPNSRDDEITDKKPSSSKKVHIDEEDSDDFVVPLDKKKTQPRPSKKLKSETMPESSKNDVDMGEDDEAELNGGSKTPSKAAGRGRGGRAGGAATSGRGGRGGGRGKSEPVPESSKNDVDMGEDDEAEMNGGSKTPSKAAGRGRGGRAGGATTPGRGRGGGGRGGFMNFGERKDPPHKGEKDVPEGSPNCLAGMTFVISGTLDSLEREEAEDLIKRHGGRVTSAVSRKTNFLLADEDVGGRKSEKAKELGVPFLTEDELFDKIRKSKPAKPTVSEDQKNKISRTAAPQAKNSPAKAENNVGHASRLRQCAAEESKESISAHKKPKIVDRGSITWTDKYRPTAPKDIVGNQAIVTQLREWLEKWDKVFMHSEQKGKGKKQADSQFKKAALLCGSPGIGKTTTAKLVSQMLGFQTIEVNASDSRGKANANIVKGVGGSTSNSIKELVNNATINSSSNMSKPMKSVLIMDEVDGMSAGDRGGVADLINSIKSSKIPIICICNDRYSQKLKSLVNYCLLLSFRKPTKQQMRVRLMQIAQAEGLQANEIALEELAERVNGDMRMALNQLQYMSLSTSVINYDDIRKRLLSSSKDEDISPFTAVDKLFGFNGSKLRMDERIDLCMSDPDLVPLIIQENYINYCPSSIGKDESGVKRMNQLARAADSIATGDFVGVKIRRYQQWQLSQAASFAASIIPAALMHGNRQTLAPGERNYNRFGGWLGKNSTRGKNLRLLQDLHMHVLASQRTNVDRVALRIDYFSLLLKQLTEPLRSLPKDAAVQMVVELMDSYCLSQEDFDVIVDISKFQDQPSPLEGIQPAVKAALTRAYKQGSASRVVRAADLITLPGVKKAPKKRVAAMLEPVEPTLAEENGDALVGDEEGDDASDPAGDDELEATESKPQLSLESDRAKGIQVQLDLKESGSSSKAKTPASRSRGSASSEKTAAAGRGSGGKRKR